jgi:hypothetical protein
MAGAPVFPDLHPSDEMAAPWSSPGTLVSFEQPGLKKMQ